MIGWQSSPPLQGLLPRASRVQPRALIAELAAALQNTERRII
jgi:hypothetical protein